ncbi:MAG: RNA 2',3'-cyclic phosphodiesterase [Candidatus Omnitrophica bacterium]|nr:RNA 2',3'-cyclic phosphodiesterase [Candidatus Omnitrophota bacterium]MBU1932611.1 RNA 2',3'-cyclic phosphodiesterase [Candidatus Omnitrophota bacterium]
MNEIRAFIAIEIDPACKQQISGLIERLKKSDVDVKWVKETQMHLTLKFLGNVKQDKVPEISAALKDIASKTLSFQIAFSDISTFPGLSRPRVIWLGMDKGAENLKELAGYIADGMEKLGLKKEGRDYKAHLTLGRVRSQKNIRELTKLIGETDFKPPVGIKINKFILFQSILTSKGPVYTLLQEFPLLKK